MSPAFSASVLRFPRINGRIELDAGCANAIAALLEHVRALRSAAPCASRDPITLELFLATPDVRTLQLLLNVFVADEELERRELASPSDGSPR